ncbi:cytochrome P450 family protein [Rhizoctonia solani]|uniref:Cytochrome P450 family protein n=1 Tax=Rhizoctonia solani TaxID=456999 RepID=A0A8H8NVG0_9AGAM|nr:cytochrome P450 family protein [Rhizoctonia solani]QRW20644.1 cytochrome P450 family protein [Rhizoctonia solani]
MPRSPITWGAGLSIVLGSLPSLVLPPALAVSVPLLLEQALPRDSASEFLRLFLDLPTAIMTVEPEVVKAILSTDFNSYEKGSDIQGIMFSLLGNGIFNSDGETWKFHRSMSRPYFTRDRISHFDNFARHADIAISKLLSRVSEPSRPAVDFQDLVARFTLDSGTEFLFGRDTRSLDAPLPYPHGKPADDSASFAAAFSRAQGQVMQRFGLAMFWPWMELFWDRTAEDMKIINAYVTPILRKKLERGSDIESKPTNEGDQDADTLLDHLVKFTQDESVIKDEIINILVAARDTTATTLTFAVYILAENPAIMSRLRDEITGRLGTSNHPTPDDLKEMKYLRAVINETLRLFPAVPVNVRAAAKSTVLHINGKRYYIPAGTRMTWSTLMMHRRKDPDADNFDPDRWLDDRLKKYVTPNPFIFLPFNAGPRICLGQQFAYNEASFFLCRLLQRVETIELVPEAHPVGTLPRPGWKNGTGRRVYEKVWPKNHLTLYCNGGLWFQSTLAAGSDRQMLFPARDPLTSYPHPEPPEKWENELFRRLEVFEFGRFLKGKEPSLLKATKESHPVHNKLSNLAAS